VDSARIDEIDLKILKMLLAESRTSFTDIAKECKITVGAVRMRYKRMWSEGIINGEVALVNPHCLGYRHIIDLGIITDNEDESEVAKYLESKPYISEVVTHMGKYSFYGKAMLSDLSKLSGIIEDLESNQKIKRVDSLIWAEAANIEFPQNLSFPSISKNDKVQRTSQRPVSINIEKATIEIDETDRKIACILARKSRTPFSKLAKNLDLSTKTVIQRYKKLRKNLLTVSTITLDLNKLGFNALASLYIKVCNRSKLTEIYTQLLRIPNVIVIIRLIGPFDLYVGVVLESFEKLFEVTEKIGKINGLEKPEVILTPVMPSWPLNLFPCLLESSEMPKYWSKEANIKPIKRK
jgi:Lrp/AsnC family transcriptional regulator for asnA, asnC and gidA